MRMLEVCLLFRNTREWEREEKGTTNFQKLKSNKVDNFLKMNSDIFWKIFFFFNTQFQKHFALKELYNQVIFNALKKLTSVIYYSYDIESRTMDAQRGNSLHCTAENSLPLPNF